MKLEMDRALHRVATETGVTVEELTLWIDRRWVLPSGSGPDLAFDDADRARIRMIVDFHRDLAIDDEAMPVVLGLLDRLHATRARLRTILEELADLPEAIRSKILQRLLGEDES